MISRLTSDLCRRAVEDPAAKLLKRIQQFDKEASATQKTQLQASEADYQVVLEQAKEEQDANASKWKKQAPEYTSAIWGAIKILLVPSVNHEKLKQGVISALETVGDPFAIMKVIVDLQPSELLVQTLTAAYSDFVKFLNKAVKYYTQ